MHNILKHPSKALIAVLALIIVGVVAGIIVLAGTTKPAPETPLQKLQSDGYSQAPGIQDAGTADIGINSGGQAEFVTPGCEAQSGFAGQVNHLGYAGKITVSCSQGFLVLKADNPHDLLSFASSLGV